MSNWRAAKIQAENTSDVLTDLACSDEGFLSIVASSFESTNNTSTTPLAGSATYTGTYEQNSYPDVMVSCQTDQAGTLYFDFSPDGTNTNTFPVNGFQVSAGIHEFHIAVKGVRYFRVRLVNDSTSAQTYLRLYTYFGTFAKNTNAPLNQSIGNDSDANIVRPSEYKYEAAQGLRGGTTTWNKWGYNSDIDSAASETVWSVGGDFTRLSSAETLDIVSTSANDDDGGTGANSVVIYGIDANFEELVEVITLDGLTTVTTTGSFLGVNRMAIYLAGSNGANVGTITATASTAATVQAEIPAEEGSTQHAFFFVQANHTALMDWLFLNAVKTGGGGNPLVTYRCFVTSLVSNAKYEVFRMLCDTQRESFVELTPSQPFVVGEKSLIEFRAETDTNNTAVTARFSFIEVQNL